MILKFSDIILWHWWKEASVPKTSCLVVLIQYRLVMDRQTDGHRAIAYTALVKWYTIL